MNFPIIKVMVFKESGKYYASHDSELKEVHKKLQGYDLMDLIRKNDESVKTYSPIIDGFSHNFFYTIDVDYDTETNFCTFLLNRI
jgi:hypothetical protein